MDAEMCAGDPPSPGLSDLLADLAGDDTDDASCRTPDDVAKSHQKWIPQQACLASHGHITFSTGPQHNQVITQALSGLNGLTQGGAQPFNLSSTLGRMNRGPEAKVSVHGVPIDAISTQPTNLSGLTVQPVPSAHQNGPYSAAAASALRGRRPRPRLNDLQHQLGMLTDQFRRLSHENSFLRGKLRLLERVLPYRDSSLNFLVAVKNGQQPRSQVQYFQKGYPVAPTTPPTAVAPAAAAAAAVAAVAAPLAATASSGSLSYGTSLLAAAARSHSGATSVVGLPLPGAETAVAVAAGIPTHTQRSHGSQSSFGWASADGHAPPSTTTTAITSAARANTPAVARELVHPAAVAATGEGVGVAMTPGGVADGGRPLHFHVGVSASVASWMTGPPAPTPGPVPPVVALCPGPDSDVPAITPAVVEQLKRVTPRDFQILYKHFVMQLGVLGTAAEVHGPASPQHARLESYLDRSFLYMDQVILLSPDCFVQSMYVNVETGVPERPPDDFWRTIGLAINLSPDQLQEVRMATRMHEMSVTPVAQERVKLASELSASLSAAVRQPSLNSEHVFQTLSEVDEVAERFRRNVIKEHQVQMDIGDFLCTGILTPVQVARIISASYPYIPDGIAVLHACDPARASPRVRSAE